MSQQTRIDQFYKSVHVRSTTSTISSRSKSIPDRKHSKNKWKEKGKTKQFHNSIQSDSILDCTVVYKNASRMHKISASMSQIIENETNSIGDSADSCKNFLKMNIDTNVQSQKTSKNQSVDDSPTKVYAIADHSQTCSKEPEIKRLNVSDKATGPNVTVSMPNCTNSNHSNGIRKQLFADFIDNDIMVQGIANMNMAKEGAIPLHNFNLDEIYSKNVFLYQFSNKSLNTCLKYDLCDVKQCDDLNAKILLTTIFKVLSDPINVGYFDETELDFIYSIITLPKGPQMLLARMIKRKRTWFRKSSINYPEISSELKDAFDILVSRSICTFDVEKESLPMLLELLQVQEIHQICRCMKINPKGDKESNIRKLLSLAKSKPLFPGTKGPATFLYASIFSVVEYCVRVTQRTWDIIDRIVTLLLPNQDPTYSMSDTYMMLCDIYLGKTVFPHICVNFFPIFSSKSHLVSYIEAKSTLSAALHQVKKKNWEKVQSYGDTAMATLPNLLKFESLRLKNSTLPVHVKRYMPGYVWLKVLSTCLEGIKKATDKTQLVEVLNFLLEQDCHMQASKGIWYAELALIEMHHLKNVDKSAEIVMRAFHTKNLTEVDKVNLLERAIKISKKKNGVNPNTIIGVNRILDHRKHEIPKCETPSTIISAKAMPPNAAGTKRVWCTGITQGDASYGSVETLAFSYYHRHGFSHGLHCEGALPIILFSTLFWEELYNHHVPGALPTQYQEAPSDLFTEKFYENRKEKIDLKLQSIESLNSESLGSLMEEKFKVCGQYRSIMSSHLKDNIQLKEIVCCLGVKGVTGICKRLAVNFKLWRAGFPDLFLWNYKNKMHKIVEVKGPRDVLSTKQRFWLEYLHNLGLNTEICLVKDACHAEKKEVAIEEFD